MSHCTNKYEHKITQVFDSSDDDDDDDDESCDSNQLGGIFWKSSLSMEEDDARIEYDDDNDDNDDEEARTSSKGSFESVHNAAAASETIPPSTNPESTMASTESERQILVLMLLAQVCALHDPTPRTFTVHVLELYERGIVDRESIGFLFDLGLVPNAAQPFPLLTAGPPPPPTTTTATSSPTSIKRATNNRFDWDRAQSLDAGLSRQEEACAIRNRLAQDESNNHHHHRHHAHQQQQQQHGYRRAASETISSPSSWAVENHPLYLSRYQREFEQHHLLNTGAFGQVYRATCKMDGRDYAIKRVVFAATGFSNDSVTQAIREVRCLAQCDHPNCVRYYTSWLEPSWVTGSGTAVTSADQVASKHVQRRMLSDIHRMMIEGPEAMDDDSSSTIRSNVYNNDESEYSEWTREESFSRCRHSFGHTQSSSSSSSSRSESGFLPRRGQQQQQRQQQSYRYQMCFFIQMQLCRPTTLADWIKKRNHIPEEDRYEPAIAVWGQIVRGLAHVHKKGIVHRDLKPANIFAADDDEFKIGDFGLSKLLQGFHHHHQHQTQQQQQQQQSDPTTFCADKRNNNNNNMTNINNKENNKNSHHNNNNSPLPLIVPSMLHREHMTAGIGTASYAAPEQATSGVYGPKADIFSLGLILLELFCAFGTEHERIHTFQDCRQGAVPPKLAVLFPTVAQTILDCTHRNQDERPSAQDLLNSSLLTSPQKKNDPNVDTLHRELDQREQEIARQKSELEEKDRIIEELQRKMEAMEQESVKA